jgi:hypothetical protein
MITMSPGRNVGTRTFSTQVLKLSPSIGPVDDEIIGSLQRREQRRRARAVMPHSNPGGD